MKNSRGHTSRQEGFIQIIIIILVVLAVIAGAYYFGTKNKSVPTPVASTQPSSSPVAVSTPDPATANWKTYTNTAVGFLIKYPSDWRMVGTETSTDMMGFGPANVGEDIQWAININTGKTTDQIIADMGKQFGTDRKVQQEQIMVGSLSATKVTVTTSSLPTWISQEILITKGDRTIEIGNGSVIDGNFDYFYNSFKFTN